MVTTNSEKLADRIRVLRLHGISRDAWKRYGEQGYKHYDTIECGYKYNMFDLQAALGLSQLKKIDAWWERRRELVTAYDSALSGVVDRPAVRPYVKTAHYLYAVMVDRKRRDEILNGIQARGVGVGVHFRALHLHTFYRKTYGYKRGMLPVAEAYGDRTLSLPLYPKMTSEDVSRVVAAVKEAVG
jgi:dTDP-4-amino-4,6-dideoxygalactose transaminase